MIDCLGEEHKFGIFVTLLFSIFWFSPKYEIRLRWLKVLGCKLSFSKLVYIVSFLFENYPASLRYPETLQANSNSSK